MTGLSLKSINAVSPLLPIVLILASPISNKSIKDGTKSTEHHLTTGHPHSQQHAAVRTTDADDLENVCGTPTPTARIYGGTLAKASEFPWMAHLIITKKDGKSYKCGGSLIHKEWILTAAHCAENYKSFTVRLGWLKLSAIMNAKEQRILLSKNATVHPGYIAGKQAGNFLNNDYALVKLPVAVNFTTNIRPICLPDEKLCNKSSDSLSTADEYDSCRNGRDGIALAGWGQYSASDKRGSDELRKINMTLSSRSRCYTKFPGKICAKGKADGQGGCHGDSGSALVCYKDNIAYQIGIVSGGFVCGKGESWFARVCSVSEWIRSTMGISPKISPEISNGTTTEKSTTPTKVTQLTLGVSLEHSTGTFAEEPDTTVPTPNTTSSHAIF